MSDTADDAQCFTGKKSLQWGIRGHDCSIALGMRNAFSPKELMRRTGSALSRADRSLMLPRKLFFDQSGMQTVFWFRFFAAPDVIE
ncbi:hypothetical protein [Paraburkholderia sartisoli]|uniref:hypothetical protein n=1 Tax=Paraburkholderia sartisoli TaxID=83784 RepID=UPI0011606E39|nr:hypothetical protein [Paraburkholderia sartisoli]